VLVEFPPTHVPADAEDAFFRLRLEGITPVVAHPERNPTFWGDPDRLVRLREQGALAQATAGAFSGMFRREARACALALLERRAIDLIASDAHRQEGRAPGLAAAARIVSKRAGATEADRLTVGVPRALLDGTAPPGAAP
jgi:protein-tyrosine phosphatase